LEKLDLSAEQLGLWTGSVSNYAYWWRRMRQDRDPTKIVGEDNFFRYLPRKGITLRIEPHSDPLDALRVAAAAMTCGASLEISWTYNKSKAAALNWLELVPVLRVVEETDEAFLVRVKKGKMERVRLLEDASDAVRVAAAESGVHVIDAPVLANGRLELLHYLREVAISIDYHRYGNLGMREGELRKPIL
jgi:RHH-type proline utilization regulon transcriptional repressor/proline dehydrogenase/delta 1-pyrroline-5-carboxylate dehydrogenase